ncbi:MAG: NAD(P)-dependent oxidoreductase [Rhodocyclaceae bacterium]|nr:NAD(P)-dependent oxidoreductase [Rhodocyclaceae bacterium]MCA3133651.1 NAD(P)-dependent oxidoreductase [Rhodocyclaceae bacterium]MCA3144079.1 NAD(P)-dependent oxidoreductase [Rhodocyclaceae bacterium]
MSLAGRTVFITGASRGIGRAIALRCARDGARVVVTGKTSEPHPKLSGTIHSVAAEVQAAGGEALAIQLDVRDEHAVSAAVERAARHFGGIDVLVNNASAISLTPTAGTPLRRWDLMHQVNARGTFACTQACLPWLERAPSPHILTLSPPLNLKPRWFRDHGAYSISKYGMSLCTLGFATEFAAQGIAANSLWPRTTVATAAVEVLYPQAVSASRTPRIMADAAWWILTQPSRECTGNFFVDEEVLRGAGVTDFSGYAVTPGAPLAADLFLD